MQLQHNAGNQPYGCDHLCNGDVLAFPDAPTDGWVVLATITLPADVDTPIAPANISFADRHPLYSAAMLREMAICSYAPQSTPQPQPSATTPEEGTVATPDIYPISASYSDSLAVTIVR